MDNISFKAKIIPTYPREFAMKTIQHGIENFVGHPWTLAESVVSKNAFTKQIMDCTAIGIKNKEKTEILHLSIENLDKFDKITEHIKSNFDLKSPDTEVILLGAKPECTHGPESYRFFDMFVKFFTNLGTSLTILKGGTGEKSLAHSSASNAWLVSSTNMPQISPNTYVSPLDILKKMFNELKISEKDQVRWF